MKFVRDLNIEVLNVWEFRENPRKQSRVPIKLTFCITAQLLACRKTCQIILMYISNKIQRYTVYFIWKLLYSGLRVLWVLYVIIF